jgi:translation elongation factor EF-Tu-like GTPase
VHDDVPADDGTRVRWLARLGTFVDLDFPFFPVAEVFDQGPGATVAVGELGTGRIALGDELTAIGYLPSPVAVRVVRIEQPDTIRREVHDAALAVAGQHYGLTLEHDPATKIVPGQAIAPAGRLRTARAIDADVWVAPADEWPVSEDDRRFVLGELAEGRGLNLFFHTHAVAARAVDPWRPEPGLEYRLRFELAEAVPLYDGARFGLRYETLTTGAGFVR